MQRGLTATVNVACYESDAGGVCRGAGFCGADGFCVCKGGWTVHGAQLADGPPTCNSNETLLLVLRLLYTLMASTAFAVFLLSFQNALRKRRGRQLMQLLCKSLPIIIVHCMSATFIYLMFSENAADETGQRHYMKNVAITGLADLGTGLALVSQTVFLTTFRSRVIRIASAQGTLAHEIAGGVLSTRKGIALLLAATVTTYAMPLVGLLIEDQRVIRVGYLSMATTDLTIVVFSVRIASRLRGFLVEVIRSCPSGAASNAQMRRMLARCNFLRAYDGTTQTFTLVCHAALGIFFETLFPFSEYIIILVLSVGFTDALMHSYLSVLRKKPSRNSASRRRSSFPRYYRSYRSTKLSRQERNADACQDHHATAAAIYPSVASTNALTQDTVHLGTSHSQQ